MDSPDQADVLRRLRVIESALGIDLEGSGCTGMPSTCKEPSCGLEACPTVHNKISLALDGSDQTSEQNRILRHLVDLLYQTGILTQDILSTARLRAEGEVLRDQIRRGRELERMIGKVGSNLNAGREMRLREVQALLTQGDDGAETLTGKLPREG